MLFKHYSMLEQEFSSPYHFTVNQNFDNESLNIHPLHVHLTAFDTHSLPILMYYGGIKVMIRYYYGINTV